MRIAEKIHAQKTAYSMPVMSSAYEMGQLATSLMAKTWTLGLGAMRGTNRYPFLLVTFHRSLTGRLYK